MECKGYRKSFKYHRRATRNPSYGVFPQRIAPGFRLPGWPITGKMLTFGYPVARLMLLHEFTLEEPHTFNASLYARFMQLFRTDRVNQTHHFAGRFENIYIDEADIPGYQRC